MSPIGWKTYKVNTEKWWIGKRVRSLRDFRNGVATLPAGTIFKVLGKQSGFALASERCECCGLSILINKVTSEAVELMQEGGEA